MGSLDGWLAAGDLPEGHHVVWGPAGVAGADAVHSRHFEGVDGEWLEVGHVVARLVGVGGDHLVAIPVGVLALQDVDDVVEDGAVVGVEGRGPGENHTPRVEFHDQRLPGGGRHVWDRERED